MKIARECSSAALAWIALLAGGSVIAQQNGAVRQPMPYAQLQPEAVANEALIPGANGNGAVFEPNGASGLVLEGTPLPNGDPSGPCCSGCGRGSDCPPLSYIIQGARVLGRTKPRDITTSEEFFPLLQAAGLPAIRDPAMTTRAIDFSGAGGYTVTFGRHLGRDQANRDHFLEFTYWGLNEWNGSKALEGIRTYYPVTGGYGAIGSLFAPFQLTDNLFFGNPFGGFNGADHHEIRYGSQIHDFELNLRISPRSRADRLVLRPNGKWERECQPGQYVSYLFGARYVIINESFHFDSSGIVELLDANLNPIGSFNSSGSYGIFTHNNLLGLQGGAEWAYRRCRIDAGVRGKVGPFVNVADQDKHIVTVEPMAALLGWSPLDIHRSASYNQVSVIGEVGFFADYRLTPHVVVHGSWDFMWVTGLALAANQLDFNTNQPNGAIDTFGSITYQGATLQLELNW